VGAGRPSVLLLAGTAEAAALAGRLVGSGAVDVLASLAGRTRDPAPLPCPVRTGGFGGAEGLAAALRDGGHALVVDATHPFAAAMPGHAARAAAAAGVPRLRLVRPPWRPVPGDDWVAVPPIAAAAAALDRLGSRRALLTVGRQELAAFAGVGAGLVVRSIDPPDPALLPGAAVVLGRPPFAEAGEAALLAAHGVDTLVTRNSGGAATAPKLAAARAAGVRVVIVERPAPPPGPVAETVDEAAAWVAGYVPGVGATMR
jgi:precorrin-6A/cobalt-precorrin-6A reductase